MDEEKFGAIANFNSNRRQLEKIKKDLEEKSSPKEEADLKPPAGGSEEVIGEKNKKLAERKETDEKQKKMEEEADKVFGGIFGSEEVREKLNDIVSDKTRERVLKSLEQLKGDIISYSKRKDWSSLGWKEGELERTIKRISREKMSQVFKENKVSNKTIYDFLAEKVLKEKEKRKEQKEQLLSKEKKEFLEDFKNKVEKGILEKLNKEEGIDLGQNPTKEFVKLRKVTPLAKEAIFAVREAFQKNKNLREGDIVDLLQKGTAKWEYLSQKERDLIMTDFERLARNKEEERTGKKEMPAGKKEKISKSPRQLEADIAESLPKTYGKRTYAKGVVAEEKRNKFKEEKKEDKALEEKPEIIIEKGEEIKSAEETEKERAKKAQEDIEKYFPKRSMEEVEKIRQKEADEKIKEFFSKGIEEIERKGIPLSRQEELEKIKDELEQARKDYLEIDYKKKKAWKRMADFFGKFVKTDQGSENDDILHYKNIYLNKLFDYKNALLEDAKARGASNKELGDLIKLFGTEVNCNLADVRDQVKMENQEGKFIGLFTKQSKNIINWYSKLPRYKKLAIGAAFGLTAAAGAGFGGAAAAGAMGVAVSARRIFLGAVTGTGVALGAEVFLRRRTEKGIENDARAITEQFEKYESLSLEEKLKLVDEKIKWAVGDVDKKIARHGKTKLAAASLGILAGTFIGSGIASELFGEGFKKTTDFAKRAAEYFGYHLEVPVPVGEVHAPGAPAVTEAPEVSPVELTIEKGSSLEGTLIDYIKDHQAEIYDHHPELKNFDPGQIAHRMYLDYLHENVNPLNKSLDLIYPGAEIEINPAALEISEFSDTKGAIGRAIEQVAGNHEKWAGMKNLSLKELAGAAKNKIAGLSSEYGKFWGPEAEVKSGEKLRDWIARIVRLAAEKK